MKDCLNSLFELHVRSPCFIYIQVKKSLYSSIVVHRVGAYFLFPWHEVTRSISIPPPQVQSRGNRQYPFGGPRKAATFSNAFTRWPTAFHFLLAVTLKNRFALSPTSLNVPLTLSGEQVNMCLAQEQNAMIPLRAWTRTARSGVQRTNH